MKCTLKRHAYRKYHQRKTVERNKEVETQTFKVLRSSTKYNFKVFLFAWKEIVNIIQLSS